MRNIEKIVDNTCNGKCSKCGQCCGEFLPVTKKEIKKIKEYVKEHNIKPTNRRNGNNIELRCAFWDKDIGCKIYEVRPFVCRDFKCNNKDWLKRRKKYSKRADYNAINNNGHIKKMASFDDLIYDDLSTLITFLIQTISVNGKVEYTDFISLIKYINREDLLQYLKFDFERSKSYERN